MKNKKLERMMYIFKEKKECMEPWCGSGYEEDIDSVELPFKTALIRLLKRL